jgi:hypothetical protein
VRLLPGQVSELFVGFGGLLPPLVHPYFADVASVDRARVRRRLLVQVDGKLVLSGEVESHETRIEDVLVGRSRGIPDIARSEFTGKIEVVGRAPASTLLEHDWPRDARAWDMVVEFQAVFAGGVQPLLSSGRSGAGDLITVHHLPGPRIQLGWDHWGAGEKLSEPVAIEWGRPMRIRVVPDWGAGAHSNQRPGIYVDDQLVLERSIVWHPADPHEVTLGCNAIQASGSAPMFGGTIRAVTAVPTVVR